MGRTDVMKSLAKLKDEARRFEQEEAWSQAIDVYLRVLQNSDSGAAEVELPLYNRIGDLYVRLGEPETAVAYYEDAAERYAEAGLFNNAIALCNKALRYAPERIELLRKLGQYSASQGFLTDARSSYLDYAERMLRKGDVDEAFAALEDFANLSEDPTIRELLGRKLQSHGRSSQAVEELKRAYAMRLAAGEQQAADALRDEIYTIDPNAGDLADVAAAPRRRAAQSFALPGLVELADDDDDGDAANAAPAAGAKAGDSGAATSALASRDAAEGAVDHGLDEMDNAAARVQEDAQQTAAGRGGSVGADDDATAVGGVEGLEPTDLGGLPFLDDDAAIAEAADADLPLLEDEGEAAVDDSLGELSDLGTGDAEQPAAEEIDEPLPMLSVDGERADESDFTDLGTIAAPGSDVDVDEAIARARAAAAEGRRDEAVASLLQLRSRIGTTGEPLDEVRVLDALIEMLPDEVQFHQSRVEVLVRAAETARLVDAYLALAGAFERTGSKQHARMVHQQVLDLDPGNTAALRALDRTANPASAGDYVDLGVLLAEENPEGDTTRFFVSENEPTGDDDRDFAELLSQFKAKIAQNLPPEDAGSHYDLGLAFKEMGLIDEAISAFQVALRSGDERLKIYEELGRCFFAKGQHNVAVKVLARGLEGRREDELELLGVFYYLGRAYEELGRRADAREAYERVIALDVGFQDVAQRLHRL